MHFYFIDHTKKQLDIANTTHNVYQIVLHLPNCASPKIRGSVPTSRICWWQKREQSTTAFFSIKTKAYFFKNDTLFSTKRHVTFNKTTRCFQQNNTSLSTKVICSSMHTTRWRTSNTQLKTQKTNYFLSILAHTHAYTHT